VYLADQTDDETSENIADYIRSQGFDVVEATRNAENADQVFIVTRSGRPPCSLEKNQITDAVYSGLELTASSSSCHYLPKRLMMIKQDLGLVAINLIS
jgi:hypothetical protein